MQNNKLKIYITLDVLLENPNTTYLINNNLYEINELFIKAIKDISLEFKKLVDIVIISKENDINLADFLKELNLGFKYEFKVADSKEILNLHKNFTKDFTLIDLDEELLAEWTKLNGKAIKYTNVNRPKKSSYELLEIKNNYESSDEYYNKLVNYIHLCH